MKKTCDNCYFGANGRKTFGNTLIACKKLGTKVRTKKQRVSCKYWRDKPPTERKQVSYFGGF